MELALAKATGWSRAELHAMPETEADTFMRLVLEAHGVDLAEWTVGDAPNDDGTPKMTPEQQQTLRELLAQQEA